MMRTRAPLFSRLLFLMAWFQGMGPTVSSVADAWRLDKREAYVHMESESGPGCALVHAHDCVLCAIATAPNGSAAEESRPSLAAERVIAPASVQGERCESASRGTASQRAPPVKSV